jgi:hypothetical protein
MAISDSITDVNLPVFSKKTSESLKSYIESFSKNFDMLFYFIFIVGITVSYWSTEILIGADYFIYLVGLLSGLNFEKNIYERYQESLILFLPMLLSIIFYSFLNIIKSSFFIPLEKLKNMIVNYLVLLLVTALSFLILNQYLVEILAMAISLFLGSLFGFILSVFFIKSQLHINILDWKKFFFSIFSVILGLIAYFINLDINSKIVIYLSFIFFNIYIFKINIVYLFNRRR